MIDTRATSRSHTRHWLAYITESAIASGDLCARDAVDYFTDMLFGTSPSPKILQSRAPYETTLHLLQRLYRPIVEAASRDVRLSDPGRLHVFFDVSVTGRSAVLVVYFPEDNQPHRLLLLDAVKAWELVFANTRDFNAWGQERYGWIAKSLGAVVGGSAPFLDPSPHRHDAAGAPSGS